MFGRNSKAKTEEFETACMAHMDSLYASALKMTRNQVEAEELVQDTFVRAFRFKKNFEWGTNLKAWLFRILTNTFINDYRHRKHEQKYMERTAVEPLYDEVLNRQAIEYTANPENHVFTKFFKEDLDSALEELPEDFRMAVVLSDIEGFSYKEIADILDKPIGTVMSRLHRGRKLLQRSLVDYAVEAGVIPNAEEVNAVPSNVTPLHSKKETFQ